MTKDDFKRRWRNHVAGVIALGTARVRKRLKDPLTSSEELGEAILHLADTADELLAKLYDDIVRDAPNTAISKSNGPLPKAKT